jgi:hypothetical protein
MRGVRELTDQTSLEHLVVEFKDQLGVTLRITPVEPGLPRGAHVSSPPPEPVLQVGLTLERFHGYDRSPAESAALPPLDLIWRAQHRRRELQERKRLRLLQTANYLCFVATVLAAVAMVVSLLLK